MLSKQTTGLEKESVANVSLFVAIDKRQLVDHVGRISRRQLERVLSGVEAALKGERRLADLPAYV